MPLTHWRMNCIYAPYNENKKHCRKENKGARSSKKATARGEKTVGKGMYGCATRCRFYTIAPY